jgi:hypothetical protein
LRRLQLKTTTKASTPAGKIVSFALCSTGMEFQDRRTCRQGDALGVDGDIIALAILDVNSNCDEFFVRRKKPHNGVTRATRDGPGLRIHHDGSAANAFCVSFASFLTLAIAKK